MAGAARRTGTGLHGAGRASRMGPHVSWGAWGQTDRTRDQGPSWAERCRRWLQGEVLRVLICGCLFLRACGELRAQKCQCDSMHVLQPQCWRRHLP